MSGTIHQTTSGPTSWACSCGDGQTGLTPTEAHHQGAAHFKTEALDAKVRRHAAAVEAGTR